ncbi:hypothetical protein MKX07_002920 [Trichoderma sp. CBMAI-0711]|nr:hypothetical protein MKX07_002920 [Trichoderma sp. CBMAI-0711]
MPFRQRMARHFGDSLAPEKAYLSYYDVLLTVEDIKSLKNDWLTDNNIAFWEEYLERETLPRYPQARIILLRPSMTFLLMKEPDMAHVRSALPDFSKVTHVFLPINDNRNVAMAEGGSHWSLLLVSVLDGIAFHYDSLGGANYGEANLATRKLSEIVKRPIRFVNLDDSPQQENGSDCGVFVCLLMRHLLVKRLLVANAREKVSMSMAGKMVDSNGGRKEMLRIIENLRKEGEHFQKLLHEPGQQGGHGSTEQLLTPASTPPDSKKAVVVAGDAKTAQLKTGAAKATDSKTRASKAVTSTKAAASATATSTKSAASKSVALKTASKSVVSKSDMPKPVTYKAGVSKTNTSKTATSKTVAQPERRASAKAPGKGQIQTPATAKRPAKATPSRSSSPKVTKATKTTSPKTVSPIGKPLQRARSTSTPIVRMVRIQPPPRDPNKPTMLEIKFASNKRLSKKTSTPALKKPAAAPIKDRGLRAALE